MTTSVTELLQQPGSFTIELREGTPLSVRESVPYEVGGLPFGHIAITPQRLPPQSLTRTAVLSVARWCGRIQSRSNRMHTFGGHGLPVWLADADDKCDIVTAAGGGAPVTFASILSTYVLPGLGNGITLGDTSNDTGTTRSTAFNNVTPIDLCNEFADATGNAWRINPDGTLDLGDPSALFADPPRVVLMRGGAGRDTNVTGLPCPDLDVSEDFDDYATYCYVTGESGATGSASVGSPPKDFGATNDATLEVGISAAADTTGACNTTATAWLNLHKSSRRQVSGSIRGVDDPRSFMEPGDQVYLFEPEAGLVDTANQLPFTGQTLYPTTALLRGITWLPSEGQGVYGIQTQDGSDAIVDLSDWIAWASGDTRLELGAPRRPAAQPPSRPFGSRTA